MVVADVGSFVGGSAAVLAYCGSYNIVWDNIYNHGFHSTALVQLQAGLQSTALWFNRGMGPTI